MKPLVVFGDASSDLVTFQNAHPSLKFISLKQIHSNRVVASSEAAAAASRGAVTEADALWSATAGEALCIRTADCLPVLFFAPSSTGASGLIAAAHAGWRGLASAIMTKTISELKTQGADLAGLQVWIGPHIRLESFEVGTEVSDQLEAAYALLAPLGPLTAAHVDPSKRYVNLERLAVAELLSAGVCENHIHRGSADTLKSSAHHSFRRDGDKAGRQTSFIALV